MDASEVKSRLLVQAEAVCRHLLPGGKRVLRAWHCGDLTGTAGGSLAVELEGDKAGVWADFATGQGGGNLLELWRAQKGCDFAEAVRQARDWLGVAAETKFHPKTEAKVYAKPNESGYGLLDGAGKAFRYLTERRKLDPSVLELYRVAQTPKGDGYVFPSFTGHGGDLQSWKAIALERDAKGKKQVRTSKDTAKVLFGKQACADHVGTIVITEGEIDAMTVMQAGAFAVSIPFGAKAETAEGKSPNDEWINNDWEWLQQFSTIVLCLDADEAGQKATQAIFNRLGAERCRLTDLPHGCKDANDCLLQGRTLELSAALGRARSIDPEELRNAGQYAQAVWERMHPVGTPGVEFFLPIAFRVRTSELTIWTGFNGSGKSAFVSQVCVHMGAHQERCCIASFEQRPEHTLEVMARQATLMAKIEDRERFDRVMEWLAQRVWIFDKDGIRDWKSMMRVFTYARRRYGVRHFVIDSLLKCGINDDDYNEQKQFVDFLANWAKREQVHVHLVAHSRKLKDEGQSSGKMDVRGAGAITDLACNVATVWRNKEKERDLWEAINANDPSVFEKMKDVPDAKVTFSKQRETGEEPWIHLFFDRGSKRFTAAKQTRFLHAHA